MITARQLKKGGFTLIELLVVLAIIGILSSYVLAALREARVKSRDARRLSDVKQFRTALEQYFEANHSFPIGIDMTPLATQGYIARISPDPINGGSYVYTYQARDGSGAACDAPGCTQATGYLIKAVLEDVNNTALNNDLNGTIAGVDCDNPAYCEEP
ncbi:MAG: type II secretion system protein [Patescibacteria group bacterium]